MGVITTPSTMPNAVTPICNECGTPLCWDISLDEYDDAAPFWDKWICKDCNGGVSMSLKDWKATHTITEFVNNQQPLSSEFEKILHDNLWELYEP